MRVRGPGHCPLAPCTRTEAAALGPGGPGAAPEAGPRPGPRRGTRAPSRRPRSSVLPVDPHSFLIAGPEPRRELSQGWRNSSLRPCVRLSGGGWGGRGPWTPRMWDQEIMRCKNLWGGGGG